MDIDAILTSIRQHQDYQGQMVHVEELSPREAAYAEPALPMHPELSRALARQGITSLYTHQATSFDREEGRAPFVALRHMLVKGRLAVLIHSEIGRR
ncbi:MAG: hypothetical protein ACOY9Y_13940 [Bacillota bacterium]